MNYNALCVTFTHLFRDCMCTAEQEGSKSLVMWKERYLTQNRVTERVWARTKTERTLGHNYMFNTTIKKIAKKMRKKNFYTSPDPSHPTKSKNFRLNQTRFT